MSDFTCIILNSNSKVLYEEEKNTIKRVRNGWTASNTFRTCSKRVLIRSSVRSAFFDWSPWHGPLILSLRAILFRASYLLNGKLSGSISVFYCSRTFDSFFICWTDEWTFFVREIIITIWFIDMRNEIILYLTCLFCNTMCDFSECRNALNQVQLSLLLFSEFCLLKEPCESSCRDKTVEWKKPELSEEENYSSMTNDVSLLSLFRAFKISNKIN
jgi:hypothetical protein